MIPTHVVAAGGTGEGRPRSTDCPAPAMTGKGTAYWLASEDVWRSDMRGLNSNQVPGGTSTYAHRPISEPALTITGMARSYRWSDGPLRVQTPGKKGGDMRLRNNNTANAAERELWQPAPTLYFGQRMNYCAWEGGTPPSIGVMMGQPHTDSTEAPMTQSALDLFAGAGGWSLACKRLGIDEVGVENMREALATRSAAGFKSHDVTDVWDIDYADLRGQYDGLIASPPCQTFSAAGKGAGRKALDDVLSWITLGLFKDLRHMRELVRDEGFDDRTALVLTPLHAAWEMRPEWIAWEQVPTVLPVWEACADELRSWGYSVWTGNLQAEMYGVPQTRKRAILIAHRDREVGPPTPTHSRYYPRDKARLDGGVLPWVSMAQALGWGDFTMVSNYGTGGDPANRGVREGDEPAPSVTSKVDRNKIEGRGYRNRPSPTITGGSSHAASGIEWGGESIREGMIEASIEARPEWAHKSPSTTTIVGSFKPEIVASRGYRTTVSRQNADGSVRVTVQEAGVLQSFPPDFPWQGAKGKQYLQCGNAVPPGLAEAVLRAVV